MKPEFSELSVLCELGLTLLQAKVYLALIKFGPSRVSAASKNSNVVRPDVYRTLSKLKELCLVEEIIKKPLEYKAITPKQGLRHLLETKTDQYRKLRAETQILLDSLEKGKQKSEYIALKQVEAPEFVLIPKGITVIERIKAAIEAAQRSIDVVVSWKRFSRGITHDFAESMEKAWAKKVKSRFLIGGTSDTETAKHLVQFCKEKPCCQIRYISGYPETILGIYDKKEIFIISESRTDLPGSAALWSSNHSLLGMAKHYFEIQWLTSMEESGI